MTAPCKLETCMFEGFEAFQLSNGQIASIVIPELGGKIASLVHMPSEKEWLWKNPYLHYREPVFDASYVREFDFGGIDECFPSISAVMYPTPPWQGSSVPDHGEIWAQPWNTYVECETEEKIALHMDCYGVRFPYHFERRLILEKGRAAVRLEYRVNNFSLFPFPCIWSIHPLVQVEPGMLLLMPNEVNQVRVDFSTNDWLGKGGTILDWPKAALPAGGSVNLSTIQPPALGQGVKYFTLPLSGSQPVETALIDTAGRKFAFRFQPGEVTHIGIWMNCAGWTPIEQPPYYNLAFEPCIGGSDSLITAVQTYQDSAILGPREERRWWLEIALT